MTSSSGLQRILETQDVGQEYTLSPCMKRHIHLHMGQFKMGGVKKVVKLEKTQIRRLWSCEVKMLQIRDWTHKKKCI